MSDAQQIAVRNVIADLARCIKAIDDNDRTEMIICRQFMVLSMSHLLDAFPTIGKE